MKEFLEKFTRDKFGNYIRRKWNERECDENTLTEQPIGLLGSNPRINLSKSTKYPTGKFGRPEGDVDGDDLTCYISNIKNTIDKCKTMREYKVPDNRTNELSKKLFISMKGPSTGNETKKVLNEIKDKSEFCKVSNNFYYNNQGLNEWINDEMFLSPVDVWQIIKTKVGSDFIKDSCPQSKYES